MRRGRLTNAKAALSAGAVMAGLLAGMAAAAPAASAASYPTCNGSKSIVYGSGSFAHPYYKGTGSRDCILAHGNTSAAVSTLQSSLRNCYGYTSVAIDGVFGDKTEAALEKVQAKEEVADDGVYGPNTRKAMKWYVFNEDVAVSGCKYVNR